MPTTREVVGARLARRAAARRTPTLTRKLASAHALACEHGCRQRHSMGCVAGPNLGSPAASCVAALRFGAMLSAESSSVLLRISCFWSQQALVGGGLTKSQATPTCSSRSSRHRRWVRLWRHGHRAPLPHCGGCLSAGARRTSYGLVQSFCKHGSLSWRGDSWRGGWAVAPRAAGPCGAASSFSVRLRMHQLVCVPY